MQTDPKITADVRRFLSHGFIRRAVDCLGTKEAFIRCKDHELFPHACDNWHGVYWRWIDQETPQETVERSNEFDIDWNKFPASALREAPGSASEKRAWLLERFRQEMRHQAVLFLLGVRGSEASDPNFYESFSREINVANKVHDQTYWKKIAEQKSRKPAKDKGDRRLKYQLLFCWIPACLWAITTEGVAGFLNDRYPRTGNKPYEEKTISDARRKLGLFRSARPIWRELKGTPLRLVSFR